MKKSVVLSGIVSLAFIFSGCSETLGNAMLNTGMTPDVKVVDDPIKVEKRLQSIAENTIRSTKFKPISSKDVLVFNESSVPPYCVDAGWIIVTDMKGFDREVEKKIGLFTQSKTVNSAIGAIKKRAATLGIEAVNDYFDTKGYEILNQYIQPYETVQYIISPNQIRGNLITYERCSTTAEARCKKTLHNNKGSRKIRKTQYHQCLVKCSMKEHGKMADLREILYGVKAWVCAPEAIKKLRNGENTLSVAIEYKAAEISARLKKSLTRKKVKSVKNAKKKEIFKF